MSRILPVFQNTAEDLWDTYHLALANDAVYLGAAANYEAAKLDLTLAKTGFRPTITSTVTLGEERSDLATELPDVGLGTRTDLFDAQARLFYIPHVG